MAEHAEPQIGRFGDVDSEQVAERFLLWLEWIEQLPAAVALRMRSYELLAAGEGDLVIDVGCGTGKVVAELLARKVAAIGVDSSEKMLSAARRRFPECDFKLADAQNLPFENGSVARYRAERLYQHVRDPRPALAEARRVIAKDGKIVIVDQDYDMWAIDSDDQETVRLFCRAQSDAIASRWFGRQARGLLLDAGFQDVTVEVMPLVYTDFSHVAPGLPAIAQAGVTAKLLSQERVDVWLCEQELRGRNGHFFRVLPFFIAVGRQP